MLEFVANVKLSKITDKIEELKFSIDAKAESELYWDDVVVEADKVMLQEYPIEDFPNASVSDIFIISEGARCPVVSESLADSSAASVYKEYMKILILPEYTYTLSPEAKLWLTMKDLGLTDAEFDHDKMHQLLSIASEVNNEK